MGGGAVGEVDWVCRGDGEGARVEGYGCCVVFARHGGVALGFEEFGFGGCGARGGAGGFAGSAAADAAGSGFIGGGGCCRGGGTAFGGAAGAGRGAGCGFAFEFFVDGVDGEEGLGADGVGHVGFVGGVDVEGVGDAGGGDFDGFAVFGGEGAVFEGGAEEVDYGEGETLFRVEGRRLEILISGLLRTVMRRELPWQRRANKGLQATGYSNGLKENGLCEISIDLEIRCHSS